MRGVDSNLRVTVAALVLFVLGGCATGGVKSSGEYAQYKYVGQKFGSVSVSLSPELQSKLQAGKDRLDTDSLNQAIRDALQTRGILDANATNSVDVTLRDGHLSSLLKSSLGVFSMGANERLVGTVVLKQDTGLAFNAFEVSASYDGGGLSAAGILYHHFGALTAKAILGEALN